jgi:hypothetical protein
VSKSVGGTAGLDDLSGERQPVNNRSAQSRVSECLCPGRESLVGGNSDSRALFPFGENLEQQPGSAPIQLQMVGAVGVEAVIGGAPY